MKTHLAKMRAIVPKMLLVGIATVLLASGVGTAHFWQQGPEVSPKESAPTSQQDSNAALTPITETSESQDAALSPAVEATPGAQSAGGGMQILATVPRSTFMMGEDSGVVTVSTSNGKAVAWNIWAPDQSITISYVDKGPQFSGTPKVSFKVKTNPYIAAKTYTLNVQAISYGTTPKMLLATKALTFTITQEPDPLVMSVSSNGFNTYDNSYCVSYIVSAKNPMTYLVIAEDVQVNTTIISGDPNSISLDVRYDRTCLYYPPTITPGDRVLKITATHNGNTVSKDITVSLGSY